MGRAARSWQLGLGAAVLLLGLCLGGVAQAVGSAQAAEEPILPRGIAAIGDSFSSGWGAIPAPFDNVTLSWATGRADGLDSHYERLVELGAPVGTNDWNLARAGTEAADLAREAAAVPLQAGYVTISVGAADLCIGSTDRVADLTAPPAFERQVGGALYVLTRRNPNVRILVTSIPDFYAQWRRYRDDPEMQSRWTAPRTCPLLVGPNATPETRRAIQAYTVAYNSALARTCAAFGGRCRYDGGAVYRLRFSKGELSPFDGLHLSAAGEARVAAATWEAGWYTEATTRALEALGIRLAAAPLRLASGAVLLRLVTAPRARVSITVRGPEGKTHATAETAGGANGVATLRLPGVPPGRKLELVAVASRDGVSARSTLALEPV